MYNKMSSTTAVVLGGAGLCLVASSSAIFTSAATGLFGGGDDDKKPSGPSTPPTNLLPSGRYVKLIHTIDKTQVINLSEVEVFGKNGTTSIAKDKTVTASSVLTTFGSLPELVDGNLTNNTHTLGTPTEFDYLMIDLGSVQEIEKIKITNRVSCCKERAQGIKVIILGADGTTVVKETPPITTTADTYTFTFPGTSWS